MTNLIPAIDNAVRAAALANGFADVSILSQMIRDRPGVMDAGEWFLLSTKRHDGAEWEFLGRRKSKDELVGLLENAAARNVSSKR